MKFYSYEIKYNKDGEIISEYFYSKMSTVERYIYILTDRNFNVSELKFFRNSIDITPQVNRFLMK